MSDLDADEVLQHIKAEFPGGKEFTCDAAYVTDECVYIRRMGVWMQYSRSTFAAPPAVTM